MMSFDFEEGRLNAAHRQKFVDALTIDAYFKLMVFKMRRLTASALFVLLTTATLTHAQELKLLPAELHLVGPENRQRLLAEKTSGSQYVGQGDAQWTTSDPKVATVDNGVVVPQGNGTATITAKSGQLTASAKVTVERFEQPHVWTFRNHVLAVLAKTGCNSGACHGALAGKGGFRLSLRGYDPNNDFYNIVKQQRGRRVELADPGQSLLLTKPTGALPHKGGIRFDSDSQDYRVVAEWLSAGALPPAENDPRVSRLEMLPEQTQLTNAQTQDLVVRAHYSDGRVEDVTRWVKFTSADETVARVDNEGKVTVIGAGEGAITGWFASKIVIGRVTVPFGNNVAPEVFAHEPRRNFIDELVLSKLQTLKLKPSPLTKDEEFVRRVFLDTIGTLPKLDETRAFLDDKSPDKRERLIDALLARPEFVDYWTYKWSDMLLINGQRLRPMAVKAYYNWVHQEVATNTPWDELVRKLVTSSGSSVENGATNFYALHQDPETMAENVSQAFLGLAIGCAKCHNHPLEKWTNDEYYGFANLFARVRAKGWGGDFRSGDGVRTLYVVPTGDLIQPLTGKPQPPRPLDSPAISLEAPEDRRLVLADWLTSSSNLLFARSITNRVWANYFGVGLVEPIDDLRISNPASNETLLNAAAQHLIDNKYDLKSLMRTILQSQTYQRSSVPLPENRDDKRFYSRYYTKRLMAEVLLDAISQVTEVPTKFDHIAFPGGDRQKTEEYPLGTRAIQLRDSAIDSYFLKTFGRNAREITCECERSEEASMVQVLHIANGETVNEKLKSKDSRVGKLLAANRATAETVDELFMLCFSRQPTSVEKQQLTMILEDAQAGDAEQKRQVLEDVFWSLLSTREFLFNH